MSIDRWMDKEIVVRIHDEILASYKKEVTWVSSNEVDEPRAFYTDWSKSEREKQISYINEYIWNLERWYWWTYLQGNSGDADIENFLKSLWQKVVLQLEPRHPLTEVRTWPSHRDELTGPSSSLDVYLSKRWLQVFARGMTQVITLNRSY